MNSKPLNKWNATGSYALLQIATWCFYAAEMSYSSNLLYGYGFSDGQISALLGIATALSFVLQLAVAELINRYRRLKVYGFIAAMAGVIMAANVLLLIPSVSAAVAVCAFGTVCMVLQMVPSLTNAIGMDAIGRGSPTDYSIARGMGSLGYSVMAYITGDLVRRMGTVMVPVLGVCTAAALLGSAVWYHAAGERGLPQTAETKKIKKEGNFLAQNPRFALTLLGCILISFSHNLPCNFMFQIMLSKNGGAGEQGIATAISALVELPVMFCFPAMRRWMRCDKWLRLSTLFLVIKPVIIYLAGGPAGIYAAQATQMLGFGLYTISSVDYAGQVVGLEESVRAQSYLGATVTVGALAGLSTGGLICQLLGVETMILVSASAACLGGAIIVLTAQKTEK